MVHLGNKAVLFLLCSCFFINSQNITQTSIFFCYAPLSSDAFFPIGRVQKEEFFF